MLAGTTWILACCCGAFTIAASSSVPNDSHEPQFATRGFSFEHFWLRIEEKFRADSDTVKATRAPDSAVPHLPEHSVNDDFISTVPRSLDTGRWLHFEAAIENVRSFGKQLYATMTHLVIFTADEFLDTSAGTTEFRRSDYAIRADPSIPKLSEATSTHASTPVYPIGARVAGLSSAFTKEEAPIRASTTWHLRRLSASNSSEKGHAWPFFSNIFSFETASCWSHPAVSDATSTHAFVPVGPIGLRAADASFAFTGQGAPAAASTTRLLRRLSASNSRHIAPNGPFFSNIFSFDIPSDHTCNTAAVRAIGFA